jgi:hypothetical protein
MVSSAPATTAPAGALNTAENGGIGGLAGQRWQKQIGVAQNRHDAQPRQDAISGSNRGHDLLLREVGNVRSFYVSWESRNSDPQMAVVYTRSVAPQLSLIYSVPDLLSRLRPQARPRRQRGIE